MKPFFRALAAAAFLSAGLAPSWNLRAQTAGDTPARASRRTLPVSAGDLLKLMPDPPKGWTVTSSRAAVQLTNWVLTVGIRNLEYTPPPKEPEPGKAPDAPVKWTTTFQLMDTGFDPAAGAMFEGFKPGGDGPAQRLLVKNCPTIITAASDTTETVDMYIAQRFLLHIDLKNQPKNSGKQWAEAVLVERFAGAPAHEVQTLPESVVLTKADELHPQNNRQTTVQLRKESEGNP